MLAVLLAGYFAQKYLPPPKPKIVGIDLGKFCFSIKILSIETDGSEHKMKTKIRLLISI